MVITKQNLKQTFTRKKLRNGENHQDKTAPQKSRKNNMK